MTGDIPSHAKCLSAVPTVKLQFSRNSVFFTVACGLEIGLRFAIDGHRSRSSRDGKLEKAIGDQPCRVLRRFPHHFVDHQPDLPAVRWQHDGIPMQR